MKWHLVQWLVGHVVLCLATATSTAADYWESWLAAAEQDPQAARRVAAYEYRPAEEFYDLRHDPHEQQNLMADLPEAIKDELRQKLSAWRTAQGEVR